MSEPTATLLCWHAHGAGLPVLEGAIERLAEECEVKIGRVLYLMQTIDSDVPVPERIAMARIERMLLELDDPTAHRRILAVLKERVLGRIRDASRLHINVSPGTPAMHAVWLILHAGGAFPAGTRLWSTQQAARGGPVRLDPVDFDVSTYLAEVRRDERLHPERASFEIEARSPARRTALERLARYAQVRGAPLLLLGERGTGKTRLVETHVRQLKGGLRVVPVACGALDPNLAESTLFGHEKGAFTGAVANRRGLLAEADKGILFLDEVQDLPKAVQRKLVRVFQDRERHYRPVGATAELKADVELVCASNRPMQELRRVLDPDFFDRLSHLVVEVPPLCACREDLVDDWVKVWREARLSDDLPGQAPLTDELRELLASATLSGNLRDLQRLAALTMAWWRGHTPVAAVRQAIAEWREASCAPTTAQAGRGRRSREERLRDYRRRLALSARKHFGSWTAAATALQCSDRVLRDDAKA